MGSLALRASNLVLVGIASLLLAACASPPPASIPISPNVASKGLSLSRSLPETLPSKSVPIPNSQIVLIPSESAAGMLMPIPFVSEAIAGAMDRSEAQSFETQFAAITPYKIALAEMEKSPLYKASSTDLVLKPFLFMTDCIDGQYRLALVFHLQGAEWVGRYMYHLPTTYSEAHFKAPSPATLRTLQTEISQGAQTLRGLVERAARGEFEPSKHKADVGSLHLVGGKAAGLISPMIVIAKGADLIEESPDHVIVRMAGEMSNAGTAGGLFFGVHYFRKDQLHTFKKL